MGFDATKDLAKQSAEITHNHPEGIKGAQAVALSIYYAKHGRVRGDVEAYKEFLKRDISDWYGYDLSRTLDEIRPAYRFNESCRETAPEAIIAFLESTGFEDAIRNAISLGGDSDTLAAITGSSAEAADGIPKGIEQKALSYLDAPIREVCDRWYSTISERNGLLWLASQ
jgi:ADP-ribosylglycohydrolase